MTDRWTEKILTGNKLQLLGHLLEGHPNRGRQRIWRAEVEFRWRRIPDASSWFPLRLLIHVPSKTIKSNTGLKTDLTWVGRLFISFFFSLHSFFALFLFLSSSRVSRPSRRPVGSSIHPSILHSSVSFKVLLLLVCLFSFVRYINCWRCAVRMIFLFPTFDSVVIILDVFVSFDSFHLHEKS